MRIPPRAAALLVAAVATLTACGAPAPAPPDGGAVVQTDSGPVRGTGTAAGDGHPALGRP